MTLSSDMLPSGYFLLSNGPNVPQFLGGDLRKPLMLARSRQACSLWQPLLRSQLQCAALSVLAPSLEQQQSRHSLSALEQRSQAPQIKGLLVDAAGTLLWPAEPAAEVYLRYARKFGCNLSEPEVLARYRQAYNTPWGQSTTRYVGDGRAFWRHIVASSTGCNHEELFEALYEYYARGEAYFLTPGAVGCLERIRAHGIKTAVVSNFDTRLWRILRELGIERLWDAVIVSAEVHAEKPNPVIFEAAFSALGLPPESCLHVGDDRRNDLFGARDSGCFALLWGQDVHSFEELERRIVTGNIFDDL